jgi:hypothetical protein
MRIVVLTILSSLLLNGKPPDLARKYTQPIDSVYRMAIQVARARDYIILASSPQEHILTLRTKPSFRSSGIDFILSFEGSPDGNTTLSLRVSNQPLLGKPGDKEAEKLLEALDEVVSHATQ